MVKVKNKRNSGLADRVQNKRKGDIHKKKLNPFEVHINKEKLKVLGKKSKHDRGLPGVSRAKAIQKRKETLGTEMKLMNKTNAFIDRRIGEKNTQLTAEERMVARFAAERAKQHNRKNIFNLADDEILTHRGQTLEQVEKFDDPRSSDEDDDEGKKFGGLDDDFVAEGHFGGGMLSKTEKDGAKSHKDLIEQLIAESKKRKAEKQKEKEQTLDLTEKLDSEWKDLQPVVFKRARMDKEESVIDKLLSQAEKGADYDKMMRELKFEKRGTPSDGLKTDEKQAKEEKERLEQLEREREKRMYEEDELAVKQKQTAGKHRSADDLDDNFALEDEKEFMLAYDKDGKPLVPENVLKDYTVPNAKPKFEDGISDTSSDDENENDSEESDEEMINAESNQSEQNDGIDKNDNNSKQQVESGHESGSDEDSGEESGDEDDEPKPANKKKNLKNLLDKTDVTNTKLNKKENNESILFQNGGDENNSDDDKSKDDSGGEEESEVDEGSINEEPEQENVEAIDDFKDLKESDNEEDSGDESFGGDEEKIGSFFDIKHGDGDNLKELLADKTASQQATVIQKLIKSYDPSLAENNKDKLSKLFAEMLQYLNDIFIDLNNEGDVLKSFLVFDKLAPIFYDLAHTNKVSSKKFITQLIKEKHDKFKRNRKKVPDLDTLVFFKLVSLLYPTSDFKHPVTSPCLIFMSEILRLSKFNSRYSISRGLFVAALVLEYTALSKRLVPSVINFLRGILYLSANVTILNPIQVVPPFRIHKDSKLLNLEEDCSKITVENKMAAKDLVLNEIDDDFKIRCLFSSTLMVREFFDYFNDLEAQTYLFEPLLHLYGRIDLELYPKKVVSRISDAVKYMKDLLEVKTFTPLTTEKKKPKLLRLYEPDFQDVFTGGKSSKLPREMAERRRLQNKVKKEMKGALREIRRDKSYIASVKMRQKIQSDNIRKEKVKQIYKDAAVQQGELNKLKRMK